MATERDCVTCGKRYRSTRRQCNQCRVKEFACTRCGKQFKAEGRRDFCPACQIRQRECEACLKSFRGRSPRCRECKKIERECASCHQRFLGDSLSCDPCRRLAQDPALLQAGQRRRDNRRRALKLAAEVAGPVSAEAYAAILASGPCVYCGHLAEHVDHVRALSRGGAEHDTNLVPACASCNLSKKHRLLTEWDRKKIAYGVTHSAIVAAEYQRLVAKAESAT